MYYLLTLGGLGFGWLVDVYRIPFLTENFNLSQTVSIVPFEMCGKWEDCSRYSLPNTIELAHIIIYLHHLLFPTCNKLFLPFPRETKARLGTYKRH